jgi:putative PIN family toxin of toxin-antitoxin system
MSKLRFVLDTNILISSILTKNTPPQQTFDYCIAHGTILLSEFTLEEISTVIMRKKFDPYASLAKRINFLQVLNDRVEIVTIIESITACRDRKDDKFLEVAVNGKTDYLITGDQDLLVLHPFRNIPIITPIEFISSHQIFRANGSAETNRES